MSDPLVKALRPGEVPVDPYPFGDITWFVSARACGAKELTVGRTDIPVGGRNPLHRHPNCEEAIYLLKGEMDQVVEGHPTVRLKAGEAVLVPRNLNHQAINAGTVPAELLIVFSSADRQTVLAA